MYKILEYLFLYIVVILLQMFLFNSLNLSLYVNPLVYIAFIALLPMEISPALLLILGCLTGVSMDLVMGMAGVNTIASLFTAFCRPGVLSLIVGKEDIKEGGAPVAKRLGFGKYIRYTTVLIFLHCLVFFTFESMNWSYYYLTFARVVVSTIVTVVFVYFFQLLFTIKR